MQLYHGDYSSVESSITSAYFNLKLSRMIVHFIKRRAVKLPGGLMRPLFRISPVGLSFVKYRRISERATWNSTINITYRQEFVKWKIAWQSEKFVDAWLTLHFSPSTLDCRFDWGLFRTVLSRSPTNYSQARVSYLLSVIRTCMCVN